MKIYKKSGIYKIENIVTGDFYIGQSYNMYIRKYRHLSELSRNIHKNKFLQNSYNKYGKKSFIIIPIIYCENWELNKYEQFFINNIKPKFNMVLTVTDSRLGFKASEETKRKMSKIQSYNQNNKWWYSSSLEYLRKKNINLLFSKNEIKKIKSLNDIDKERFLFSILLFSKKNAAYQKYKKEIVSYNVSINNIKSFSILSFPSHRKYSNEKLIEWLYLFEDKKLLKINDKNIEILFINKKIKNKILEIDPHKKFLDASLKYLNLVGIPCLSCGARIIKKGTNQKYCKECYLENKKLIGKLRMRSFRNKENKNKLNNISKNIISYKVR